MFSHLYKLIKFSHSKEPKLINKKLVSLATQVQEHLHLPMYKGEGGRSSDWSRPLNLEQIRHAASDSYAGVQIFDTMEVKRRQLEPTPPRPCHAELNRPIRVAEGVEIPSDDEAAEEEGVDGEEVKAPKEETRNRGTRYTSKETEFARGGYELMSIFAIWRHCHRRHLTRIKPLPFNSEGWGAIGRGTGLVKPDGRRSLRWDLA
jgi:hypothetical protein